MGGCLDKPKVKNEQEEFTITTAEVKELSDNCLEYKGDRCSQKWYTSSIYNSIKENDHIGKYKDFRLMHCKREASILSKLGNTNVIKFVGIYYKNDLEPILVTEEFTSNLLYYLDNVETLLDSEKVKFSCGVSNGLTYLHSQQLAHLNLYTKSILLTKNFVIKIANFEYACYWDKESASSSVPAAANPTNVWEFRDDSLVYTFLPENHQDDQIWSYDAVDIYSFGCVVINIFTLKEPAVELESQVKEISIPSIKSIVINCINKKVESMQKVDQALSVYLKELEKPTSKPVETEVEIHGMSAKSGQNTDKKTEQESDRNPETLKSVTETEDVAVQAVAIQKGSVQPDAVQTNVAQPDAVQADAVQTDVAQTDVAQPDAVQTNVVQPDAVQTDTVQQDAAQTDAVQTVAIQTDAVIPQELQSFAERKVQTVDIGMQTDCEEVAVIPPVIPHEDLQDRINALEKEKSLLISRLTELEEQSFKFTNAFTTAGEGSVMKLRDTYRSLQTNGRPAANRAHKKTYKGIPYPIAEHTMLAYEEAKALALKEFEAVSEKFHSLFQLKPSTDNNASQEKENKAMRQSQQLLESFHAKPLNEKVYQILIEKYKALTNQAPDGIPKPIEDYYSELAKFTWDCVARTIPMIMSTEIGKFARDVHETKDGDDEDDDDSNKGKFVSYIYPVLFTSNSWPREIAMKGRVNILPSQESIV